jgi:negative regulator of flagellin synthesis FlgM
LREREGSPAKTDGNPQAGRGDMVTLTDTAKRLMQFQATLASDPGVDSGKVDRIRQALEDGSYHIDSMNIAGKLLETESKL